MDPKDYIITLPDGRPAVIEWPETREMTSAVLKILTDAYTGPITRGNFKLPDWSQHYEKPDWWFNKEWQN